MTAEAVLAGQPTPEARARALLLAAESTFALDEGPATLGWLDACREALAHLSPTDARRFEALADLAADLTPRSSILTGRSRGVLIGRFRGEGTQLFLRTDGGCFLYHWTGERLEPTQLSGIVSSGIGETFGAEDLDGDGFDELLQWTMQEVEPGGAPFRTESLLVYDLRGEEAVVVTELEDVLHTSARFNFGDVDGDGRTDVVVAMSYPLRGLQVFRNAGGRHLEQLRPGALTEVIEGDSDVRNTAVVDLDGNGTNELVVPAEAWKLFSVYVFEFDPEDRTFHKRYEKPVGLAVGAVPFDEDGDGTNDMVIFSLGAVMAERISKLFPASCPRDSTPCGGSRTPRRTASIPWRRTPGCGTRPRKRETPRP